MNYKKNFNTIIKHYIDIAKDLCYDESVIEKLKNAKSEIELDNIMTSARRE